LTVAEIENMAATKKTGEVPLFERARVLGAKLSDTSDVLNRKLTAAESQFAAWGLNIEANVDLGIDVDDCQPFGSTYYLCFERYRDAWRLVTRTSGYTNGEMRLNDDATPLGNASRAIRMRAAKKLPELLEKIVAEAEQQSTEIGESLAMLDRVIDASAPTPPRPAEANGDFDPMGGGDDEIPF
jgi:hypothetical protein